MLLGKENPENESELYRLAYEATGKQFPLVVEKHSDKTVECTLTKRWRLPRRY